MTKCKCKHTHIGWAHSPCPIRVSSLGGGLPGSDAPRGVLWRGDPGPWWHSDRPGGGPRQGESTAVTPSLSVANVHSRAQDFDMAMKHIHSSLIHRLLVCLRCFSIQTLSQKKQWRVFTVVFHPRPDRYNTDSAQASCVGFTPCSSHCRACFGGWHRLNSAPVVFRNSHIQHMGIQSLGKIIQHPLDSVEVWNQWEDNPIRYSVSGVVVGHRPSHTEEEGVMVRG